MGGLMKAQEGQVDQGASLTMIMAESAKQILTANQLAAQGGLDSIEQQNLDIQKKSVENKKMMEEKELALKEKQIDIDAMVEAAKIEEGKKEKNDSLTAKVVMDLLKLVDKQKFQEGGTVQQPPPTNFFKPNVVAAEEFKQAANLAVQKPMTQPVIPPTTNIAGMGTETQDIIKTVTPPVDNEVITPPSEETLKLVDIQQNLNKGFDQSKKEREFMERLVSDQGKFTFEQEVGPGSEKLHHPTKTSGVTVGAGYDMKEKSPDQIISELTSVGIDENIASRLAGAAGLSGKEATKFVKDNPDIALTTDQQKQLFGLSFSQALKRTDRDLQTMGYDPNQLSDRKLNLLADYTYNVGSITKFPKFVKALVENDFDTAAKEFERKSGNVKLGRRNKASEQELAAIKDEETTTT
tara:strand:- start:235 stop:1461 length:1227 start_codon:yes stop_codon:yes gene_type:complete